MIKTSKTHKEKIYLFTLFIGCLWCLSPIQCMAQKYIMHTQEFDLANGLSSTQITSLLHDSKGIIWLGTPYGINSYNGAQFKSYTKEDGLAHNYVLDISEDNLGNLWVRSGDFSSSSYYYSIYNSDSGVFTTIVDYLGTENPFYSSDLKIHKLAKDVNIISEKFEGKHWFYELKNKKVKKLFSIPLERNKIDVVDLVRQYHGNRYRLILYDTAKERNGFGLEYEYDLKSSELKLIGNKGYANIKWNSIDEDCALVQDVEKFDSLVSDFTSAKYFYNGTKVFQYSTLHTFNNQLVVLDRKNSKLLYYDLKTMDLAKEIPCSEQFIKQRAQDYWTDNQGGFWFFGDEIMIRHHFIENKFHVTKNNYLAGNFPIRGITEINKEINFACLFGICKEENEKLIYNCIFPDGSFEGSATTGITSAENILWIATELSGMYRVDTQTEDTIHFPFADARRRFLWQPFVDKNNNVWVGSNGLFKLDKEKEIIINASKGGLVKLDQKIIYFFHESKEGVWLCTSHGLFLVDLESETILRHLHRGAEEKSFLPLDECLHVHVDKENVFWIATKGAGVVKWNPETELVKSFTTANSELTHNIIYAIYEDKYNNLWFPSHYGLMKFNKRSEEVTTYYNTDGIAHNEFNTIAHFQDMEGNLLFGTVDGLVQFNPADFEIPDTPNPVLLTEATRLNEELKQVDILNELKKEHALIMEPGDRYVDLEFSIVNFNKNSPDKYSYRIPGFQDDWIYSDEGLVRLDALPFGTYTLEMRGKPSHNTNWSTHANKISIIVKKPIYMRWWFLLLSAFLVILLFYCAVRWNTHKFLKRQKELEQVVQERTEEIRLQAEELKVLDKVKNNFFANISHELRTPLTLILGPLSYIIDNPEKLNDSAVQKQLLVMQRNGTNLLHLIEEILDLSKLQANKLELIEEAVNVKAFIEYIFIVFEPQFENTGIRASLDIDLDGKLCILMDRKKMEKILNNFLSNAIKYTPRGGTIDLTLRRFDDRLLIKVQDSGSGIHSSDMPYIFDRFFQSKQANKKLYGGTGIGLALVKEFATLMNANVSADSTVGKGSTFTFELPIKEVLESPVALASTTAEEILTHEDIILNNESFTILVAEDNKDMRTFICDLLETNYQTIIPTSNGAEAWKILQEKQTDIDLVISDIMMPEVDGLDLVKRAKEERKLSTIPFMMLTALAAERDKLAALTIGVDDYLTKPFSVPELLARINNMLINASLRKEWWSKLDESAGSDTSKKDSQEDFHLNERDKAFIEDLREYIESNPSKEDLDLNSLAKRSLMSLRHLNRKVKAITGMPPAKFVREVQLQKARQILEDGRFASISEVAYSVGFYQPSTFTALFKKRFGIVPSQYRKKIMQQ